jgi:heme O synthase-like polyprenyltransferase
MNQLALFANLTDTLDFFTHLILQNVIIVLSLSALFFLFWNIVRFMASASSDTKRKEAQKGVLYSIASLFVIFTLWGLVWFIRASVPSFFGG